MFLVAYLKSHTPALHQHFLGFSKVPLYILSFITVTSFSSKNLTVPFTVGEKKWAEATTNNIQERWMAKVKSFTHSFD